MNTINKMIEDASKAGYTDENAEAFVCQNLVLLALSKSTLCKNATIKGGVVMRSMSCNARRATQDMDIDFIKYSLDDTAIRSFIEKLNCIPNIHFEQMGEPIELNQQDYHGKRVFIRIKDDSGDVIESKIDLGVHKYISIEQEEYCFDIAGFDDGANLLINSKEQMFTEKLRSLLKFGPNSTRYKDIFDLYYLSSLVAKEKLQNCIITFILNDEGMKEKSIIDIQKRIIHTFTNKRYLSRLKSSRKNWLDQSVEEVLEYLTTYINKW